MTQQGSSPSNLPNRAWQREYKAALLELVVHAPEGAIFNRLQELAQSSDSPDNKAERQAIQDALSNLRVLQREKLSFPDWKKE
jgi:hypothetical protein